MLSSQTSESTEESGEIQVNLKKLVRPYATTVLLIVGGFFENPFSSENPCPEDEC